MAPRPHELRGGAARATLRPFSAVDLPAFVAFWNQAFAARRNFRPLTAAEYTARVIDNPAFDPQGLILAWQPTADGETLVGAVHAFRPPPASLVYDKWQPPHSLALLYVSPAIRQQGVGQTLLRAAERWLYYCPVEAAGGRTPAYGTLEGPRPPFFGSTQRLGVSARDLQLVHFLAKRGYRVSDPGDVSMVLDPLGTPARPAELNLDHFGFQLRSIDHCAPFTGREPTGREEYTLWGENDGAPYAGLVLVDGEGMMGAHLSWYPMARPGWAALHSFWVSPHLRGQGLGRYLLDRALAEMAQAPAPRGGYRAVELHTHLLHHPRAADLYARRGFVTDEAWVTLVKT